MGCDIHLWIEGKDKKGNWFLANPRFVDYGNPNKIRDAEEYDIGRSYILFSALANVRNYDEIPFIQESRGWPRDVNSELRYEIDAWRDNGHSFGWLTPRELQEYFYKYQDSEDDNIKTAANEIRRLYYECCRLSYNIKDNDYNNLNIEDMRLVFWFDN